VEKEPNGSRNRADQKDRKKLSLWERYLTQEIGIEFKACLYFFAILFYYCVQRLVSGDVTAEILHMTEMILLCYAIGYLQVYAFRNFDEAERLQGRELAGMLVCTAIYTGLSFAFSWFDRSIGWTIGFAVYVLFLYLCVFLIYLTKRRIDDKKLNEDLKLFQARSEKEKEP